MIKKICLGLIVVFIGIQFIHPTKNLSAVSPGPNDITTRHATSPEVKAILAKACDDCHSDNTRYPWYAKVQPVSWWLAGHVNDGKRHLNFSQFGTYTAKRARKKLEETVDQTKKHEMPLFSYTLIHREAKLTDAEIAALSAWADAIRATIPAP